jgi:predicted transcriptional regulator YdeE
MNTDRATRRAHLPALMVVGIATRTDNSAERDPATASIGRLWERFYAEGVAEQIPDRADPTTILAVYTDYERDHTGPYTLLVGFEVKSLHDVPAGLQGVAISAANCEIFPVHGPMPEALIATWGQVWAHFDDPSNGKRSYTCDIEFYRTGPETKETRAEIAIAVESD